MSDEFTNNLPEIVKQLESCRYECEAGLLVNNTAFIELQRMAAEKPALVHSLNEDFEHFLSYSKLSTQPLDMIQKLRLAFEAAWEPRTEPLDKMPVESVIRP